MIYALLAILVLIFHTFVVVIVFSGALLAVCGKLSKIPWLEKAYLFSGLFVVASYLIFGACNLTLLEQSLWERAGSRFAYEGGCISHYLGFFGLKVSDDFVFWSIVTSLVLGFSFTIIHRFLRKFSQKSKE